MYVMKLQPEYFDLVKSGEKVYEVRLFDEKRRLIREGDTILFKKEPDLLEGVVVKVAEIKYFKTFLSMAKSLPIKGIGMNGKTPEQVEEIYHKFYSREDEEKYNVVAFKLELL